MIQEIHVGHLAGEDMHGKELLYEVQNTLGITSVEQIRITKVYRLEGLTEDRARLFAEQVLVDIDETFRLNQPIHQDKAYFIEVAYRPGVTNPEIMSLEKASRDLDYHDLVAIDSSRTYSFYGALTHADADLITNRLLVNKTVQYKLTETPTTLRIKGVPGKIEIIPLRSINDESLLDLSKDKLFLSLEELHAIQQYFVGIGRDPTDGELETLAQTWSEHCFHKIFRSPLEVEGQEKPSLISRLRQASEIYNNGVISAFVDNSGVIELYDGWSICGKVETHNSPSAIEPYGGAMTGSGGVFRDIMGTGQGAKVIASTDMFCVAPPNLPSDELPPGCLHPRYLLRRIVAGVGDYGNRMGIPTCNGSVHFHPDFRAKPSVIVGSYGLIPTKNAQKGQPLPGDIIVAVGGRTGRDGIHGATFSSAAMTAHTGQVNASAVQIGNAVEEKRVLDALILCRDEGLLRALTDCGAGGFSSAIGEIGSHTGVDVHLENAPIKYEGLAPWEIWISESQERMVLAVPPEHVTQVTHICNDYNVEATVLGTFTDTHRLRVTFHSETLCDLTMEFLHQGIPIRKKIARKGSQPPLIETNEAMWSPSTTEEWRSVLERVLSHGNVCSKEPIVRLYDHNVQGSGALAPFTGVEHDGPSDAAVLAPIPGKPYGVVIAHGLNPLLTRLDPYNGALWSITEAIANACAIGASIGDLALIDNFIWPTPDEHWLWALDQAVEACVSAMHNLGIPFISGKDSLSSTYRWQDGTKLVIPPVLCVSAFGRIPDISRTVSADLKKANTTLVLLGQLDANRLGGSTYATVMDDRLSAKEKQFGPKVDLSNLRATVHGLHAAISTGDVLACHDVSEGGLAATLLEMAIGGNLGIEINLSSCGQGRTDALLFTETAGCFVVETQFPERIVEHCVGIKAKVIGRTLEEPKFVARQDHVVLFDLEIALLKQAWQKPMQEIFH